MTKSKLSVQEVCLVALCTAVMVIMAQISIPMPMGVPMTCLYFAGSRRTASTCGIYWGDSVFCGAHGRIFDFLSIDGVCYWAGC